MNFPKKIALEYDLSCIIRKGYIFQNLDFLCKYEAIRFDANINQALHKKSYFLSPNVPKRWSFQKIALSM